MRDHKIIDYKTFYNLQDLQRYIENKHSQYAIHDVDIDRESYREPSITFYNLPPIPNASPDLLNRGTNAVKLETCKTMVKTALKSTLTETKRLYLRPYTFNDFPRHRPPTQPT